MQTTLMPWQVFWISGISVACLWDRFGVKCGSCLAHTFGFLPSESKTCETGVSHAHWGREGCSMRAAKMGATGDSQAGRSVPRHLPDWQSRAGLATGSEVSLSPGITVTRDQEVHGCGAAQARTSRQSGEPLTRPLAALPPPSFDQGIGADLSTGRQRSRRRKEATDPAGTLRALPVSCLTSKRRWI